MNLSQAIDGFLLQKRIAQLSDRTLELYVRQLGMFLQHTGDKDLLDVTSGDIKSFLNWLKIDYKPKRIAEPEDTGSLSGRSLRNFWIALRSFFTWTIHEELLESDPMRTVSAHHAQITVIEPLSENEAKAIMASLHGNGRIAVRAGRLS
jgi:integrase/recombinase XerD